MFEAAKCYCAQISLIIRRKRKQTEAKKGEIKLTKRNRRCHWVDLDFLLELLELFQKNQERKNKRKK